jgi:hypothetical protein
MTTQASIWRRADARSRNARRCLVSHTSSSSTGSAGPAPGRRGDSPRRGNHLHRSAARHVRWEPPPRPGERALRQRQARCSPDCTRPRPPLAEHVPSPCLTCAATSPDRPLRAKVKPLSAGRSAYWPGTGCPPMRCWIGMCRTPNRCIFSVLSS